jgi:opacity protein-like surface antigen
MKTYFGAVAAVLVASSFIASSAAQAGEYVAKPDRWSGCYGGVNAGYMGGHTRLKGNSLVSTGLPGSPIISIPYQEKYSPTGFLVGLQTGCSKQLGSIVAGVELDANLSRSKSQRRFLDVYGPLSYPFPYTDNSTYKRTQNAIFIAKARVGYSLSNFLPYLTIGVAGVSQAQKYRVITTQSTGLLVDDYNKTINSTNFGLAIGGGLEYALTDNWSVKRRC